MTFKSVVLKIIWLVTVNLLGTLASTTIAAQKVTSTPAQLPPELRGAKIYHFPETDAGGKAGNPVTYKSISYQDIQSDRLVLNLFLSVKPADRAATIHKIYFQDVRVGGIPLHIDTFDKEFKLSKKEPVDLPAPLRCSIIFTDLESLEPLAQLVDQHKIQITGDSFIEVKLNVLEKLALGGKQVVLPVRLNEAIPLQFLPDSPLMQMAAKKVIESLADPTTAAAISLAKEHLAKLTVGNTLSSLGRNSLYLISCQYALRNPKTQSTEKFVQSGTGFVVSADGKLLTTKRVIQPWKFDPQVAYLMKRFNLELDEKSYKLFAWPAGSHVLMPDGQLNFPAARSTDRQTLKVLKTAPDLMKLQDYRDPDSGAKALVSVHLPGSNDLAILQLSGNGFVPLVFVETSASVVPDARAVLLSFPYGLSQPLAVPKLTFSNAALSASPITLDQPITTGESGAPLVTPEGKVLALAEVANECTPVDAIRSLVQ